MNKERAKQVLFDIIDIFEKYNIEYFLFLGTLLGAVREKDFIEGDNDIDIGILDCFWNNPYLYKKVAKDLLKKGLHITSILENSVMTIVKNGDANKDEEINVDLYYGHTNHFRDKNVIFLGNTWRMEIPNGYMYGLSEIDFLGRMVSVPHDPEKFLDDLYLDGWREKKDKDGLRYGFMVVDRNVKQIIEYTSYLIIYGDKKEKPLDNRRNDE